METTTLNDTQRDNIISAFKGNEQMIIDSLIALFMEKNIVENEIITALYGGINYWGGLDVKGEWIFPENHKKRLKDETQDLYIARLIMDGGSVKFYDVNKEDDDTNWHLDLNKMIKGFITMSVKSPDHFCDMIEERGDAITADVYIQYCLFGEIVYG